MQATATLLVADLCYNTCSSMAQEVQNTWATARRRRRLSHKTFEALDYELYDSKVRTTTEPQSKELYAVLSPEKMKKIGWCRKFCRDDAVNAMINNAWQRGGPLFARKYCTSSGTGSHVAQLLSIIGCTGWSR